MLAKLRTHIVKNPARWQAVMNEPAFKRQFEPHGESLSRTPKGYPPDHPQLDLLKRKDHIVISGLPHAALFKTGLPELVQKRLLAARGSMRLLHSALGIRF